ncbi:MAG: polysaccharide biosynthesis protein [Alphaproteobacteria bacterium]|nr:polysaccharide biosynthesis protein [Alphaproteobacteria bacterium]
MSKASPIGGVQPRLAAFGDRAALEAAVVRRAASLFADDVAAARPAIAARFSGARVLIVGGGGTIGAVTTRLLLSHGPAAVHVVDQNENYLAELVRDLRSGTEGFDGVELRALPLDYGGGAMRRLLADAPPYDVVLNFAAMKHVRSEKDVHSLLQMLDTNLVRHRRFLDWLADHGHGRSYFAVSTDKAANPTSLMGASKRLMEDLAFARRHAAGMTTASARFANVAFSNGSLLESFLARLQHRQPLAAPRDTARYFVSQREAGELCLLAAAAVPDRHIAFPRLDPARELQSLESIAVRVLAHFGLEAERFEAEGAARRSVEKLALEGRWPLLLTPRDTSGEKEYEEFVGAGESTSELGMKNVAALRHRGAAPAALALIGLLEALIDDPARPVDKAELVAAIGKAIPSFSHVETGRNLDQRL